MIGSGRPGAAVPAPDAEGRPVGSIRFVRTLRWIGVTACAISTAIALFFLGVHDEWQLLGVAFLVGLYAWVILLEK